MQIAEIKYTGELRNAAVHLLSGSQITTDAPPDNEGKGEAFSPTDLLCVSLATCMLTTMAIKARKHGFDLPFSTAAVFKTMANNPRRVAKVAVNVVITKTDFSEEQKNRLHEWAHTCPVALSLAADVVQEIRIEYKHEKPL